MSDQDSLSEHSALEPRRISLLSRLRLRRKTAAAAAAAAADSGLGDGDPATSASVPFHAASTTAGTAATSRQKDGNTPAKPKGPPRWGGSGGHHHIPPATANGSKPFSATTNTTATHRDGLQTEDHIFGAPFAPGETPPAPDATRTQKTGQQVLLEFLHHINPKTVGLTKMLFNRHPISDNPAAYRYVVNQSTEQSDLAIILRDLTDGRLYRSGVRLVAAPWANLLFGDSFAPSANRKQIHELIYRRSTCTCIVCLLKAKHASAMLEAETGNSVSSASASLQRVSPESAMANFTQMFPMPSPKELISLGAERSVRELEIGTLIRLQSRAQAKLVFTEDVRLLFGNLAYTGPLSHEALYRNVTTLGVNYYAYNKGKKSRKVYVQGELIRLPIEMGVVKNGAQAMYLKEIGSTFVLYKPQVMSIYIGRIVFEGNSIGSFIETDIQFYVGFGQEAGAVAIYPDYRPVGPPRRLGVNELLLHHHQIGDIEVVVR